MKIFLPELSSFENLFKDKRLVIPYYQRDYIWKKDNLEKWLKDVKKLIECEDIEEIHFIGSIIYKKNPQTNLSSPEYLIIDGQQRITTFFVFCLAILEALKSDNSKKNAFLIENINQLLFLSDGHSPKLTMRGTDEKSLGAILSHKNLEDNREKVSEAYQYFKRVLGGSSMTRTHLKDYFERLKNGVKFISIKLEKEDDALEIFKSINTSGVMLTSVDLIKAEFFIIYEERELGQDCEKLAEEWENMKKRVGKENISHFFYVFLLTKYGKGEYSEKEFYSYFRNKLLQEKENIKKLWEEIIQKSRIYSLIINPQLDYWGENFYLPICEVKILDLKQLYPLIILLKERELQRKEEVAVLKKLIVYSFRVRTKRINLQQSEVMRWFRLAQNNQLESILSDSDIIWEIERSNIFWNELKEKKNLKESEIKWLLTKFYLTFLPEGIFLSPLQLEHMFPKKPDKEWWSIPEWKDLEEDKKQIKEKLNSLGNATLLTPNQNIAASNKLWKSKREEFKKDEYNSNEFYSHLEQQNFGNSTFYNIFKKFYSTKIKPGIVDVFKESVEHMVPQILSDKWKKIEAWGKMKKRELEKYIYSIGNVTLMKKEWNERAGNELWSVKIEDKNYLENSWLRYETFGKTLLERKEKEEKELLPKDIKRRAKEVTKEIKDSGIFEFKF